MFTLRGVCEFRYGVRTVVGQGMPLKSSPQIFDGVQVGRRKTIATLPLRLSTYEPDAPCALRKIDDLGTLDCSLVQPKIGVG